MNAVNENIFDVFVSTEDKFPEIFYFAGFIRPFREMTQFGANKNSFNVRGNVKDIDVINTIRHLVCRKLVLNIKDKQAGFSFTSEKIYKDCVFLHEYALSLPPNSSLFLEYARGILESQLSILPNGKFLFDIDVASAKEILDALDCHYIGTDMFITVSNYADLLGRLYHEPPKIETRLSKFFFKFKASTYRCIDMQATQGLHPKKFMTDAGNDISAVSLHSNIGNVMLLETNVSVIIPEGYWGLLAPRSSMAKSGFAMANSMGVIDSSYRGSIKIAVHRINPSAELIFPFKCAQLICIPQVLAKIVEVPSVENNTMRGTGGYGSTSDLSYTRRS